jgi:hypothetical protein
MMDNNDSVNPAIIQDFESINSIDLLTLRFQAKVYEEQL